MHPYPDEKASTEAVLRAYPDICIDRLNRREILMKMATETPCSDEPPGKNSSGWKASSQQERYVMALERDYRLQRAEQIIQAVRDGNTELSSTHSKVMQAIYFDSMGSIEAAQATNLSPSYIRRIKDEVQELMCPYCVPIYPLVCAFRAEQREHRTELLRKAAEVAVVVGGAEHEM